MFTKLLAWSEKEYSHLPWRKNRNLFTTLVSEFMLQQTTVPTVMKHYDAFLAKYPDVFTLAQATEDEVCIQWKGLGYYRRAKALWKAAIQIVRDHEGQIPVSHISELVKIQGIGLYTASALVAIGADMRALPLDANLERVLSRLFLIEGEKGAQLQKKIHGLFAQGKLLADMDSWGPQALSEAFMDLGRTYCRVQNPQCLSCPLSEHCQAHIQGRAQEFPQSAKASSISKTQFHELALLRILVSTKGPKERVLVFKKSPQEWLSGQWEHPTFILQTSDEGLKQYPRLEDHRWPSQLSKMKSFKSSITKYKVTNYLWEMSESEFKDHFAEYSSKCQLRPLDVGKENFATSFLKALDYKGRADVWDKQDH